VIATAVSRKSGLIRGISRPLRHACFALIPIVFSAQAVDAQVTGSVGLDSDYRLRGYSLSDGHPVASAQLTYDHPSGLYFSLSGLTELSNDSRFLGVIGNAGYAKRLNGHVTVDAGVLRSQIRSAYGSGLGFEYTEVYAGAYVGPVVGRVYYSPDYRTSGQSTLYGELEAGFEPRPNWRVSGHVGMLTYLNSTRYWDAGETRRDWRLSLARQLGRFEAHTSLSGSNPGSYYGGRRHNKAALTVGGSVSF
jgi:uncharacterized protein (TIGR02001 family)